MAGKRLRESCGGGEKERQGKEVGSQQNDLHQHDFFFCHGSDLGVRPTALWKRGFVFLGGH